MDFNFGPSNALARQIIAAPRADVYLSANDEWMDEVQKAGRLVPGTRRTLLSNGLVVIANAETSFEVASAEDLVTAPYKHLALADPKGVPAGRYAREWLEAASLGHDTVWARLRDRVVPALDVRAALLLVEKKSDTVGIVYRSDAKSSRRIRVVLEVPEDDGPEIRYPAALVSGRPYGAEAKQFLEQLGAKAASRIFEAHGFSTVKD